MARTGAKRRSEPGRARIFGVCGILNQYRIPSHALCHPSGVRIYFFGAFPGVPPLTGLHRRALFYSAPPGLKFRLPSSLLRSYAVAGAAARKLSNIPLQLPICRARLIRCPHSSLLTFPQVLCKFRRIFPQVLCNFAAIFPGILCMLGS